MATIADLLVKIGADTSDLRPTSGKNSMPQNGRSSLLLGAKLLTCPRNPWLS